LTDLAVARIAAPSLPLLRKEFIVDEYQLYQARIFGADAILLIAAMISGEEVRQLNDMAHELGMQTLVEIHSLSELKSVPLDADMVGVNNRDLTSFSTDISNSALLVDRLPSGIVKIAESGIKTPEDVKRLKTIGFDGFLIGEAFMSTPDPGGTLRKFIDDNRVR
jgi:indole-3-glycerol phosphate synthase